MLYHSLLTLPRTSARWKFLKPYELHQTIWKGFQGLKQGERERRFLYRHEETDSHHSVFVQSVTEPDWSFLDNEAEGTTAQMKTFDPNKIEPDVRFKFFLRSNPVIYRKGYTDPDAQQKKRQGQRRIVVGAGMEYLAARLGVSIHDLPSREEKQVEWLKNKGTQGGFTIEYDDLDRPLLIVGPSLDHIVRKPKVHCKPKEDEFITITGVDFTGILRVTDPVLFEKSLREGIGRSKAFGFGLLSIKRI